MVCPRAWARQPQRDALPLPDLAVAVRSASTWRYDIGAKKSAYERAGLPELWLVDTAADVVLVFRRSSPKTAAFDVSLELTVDDDLTSPLLPGFTCSLREVWRGADLVQGSINGEQTACLAPFRSFE